MTLYGSRSTCLSAEKHDTDIKDHLLHYFGCTEICDREDFFKHSNDLWKAEIHHHETLGKKPQDAKELVEEKRAAWEANCDSELRRIDFLRKTISNDNRDHHLVSTIVESSKSWRNSATYKNNIARVHEWRKSKGKQRGDTLPPYKGIQQPKTYDAEKDISVPIIQFEGHHGVDVKDDRVWGKFPNQKTKVDTLFSVGCQSQPEDNLLFKDRHKDRITYFHLPANNMGRAIARYFGEDRPKYHATHRELRRLKKTRSYMILRERYWYSQLHEGGERAPAHARHMRPLCATVSSEIGSVNDPSNNMVLFMPYLHWETSRKREQFAIEIDNIEAEEKAKKAEFEERKKRQASRDGLNGNIQAEVTAPARDSGLSIKATSWIKKRLPQGSIKQRDEQPQGPANAPDSSRNRVLTMGALLRKMNLIKNQLPIDEVGRVGVQNPLGQYLIDAARLYEGMTNYRDKKILRSYLHREPPLHPRRTLDQAYHWTLNSTRKRDRDQVVYRSTTAPSEDLHSYDRDKGKWPQHQDFGIVGHCETCHGNIKKVSRVVMVDQLWMWILDERTIITCFPKRYGVNKHDTSGVHKSIRMRLQDNGPDQIRTVFDMGLLILDECSKTFFDRTKFVDDQPQVLESFSKAIGNLSHQQTVAAERLWRWTDEASVVYRSQGSADKPDLHVPLLDIQPEGKLEREIKDIIEELDIMLHIVKTHKEISKRFIANAQHMLDPEAEFEDKKYMTHRNRWEASRQRRRGSVSQRDLHTIQEQEQEREHRQEERRADYHWFRLNADEYLGSVITRIEELEELRSSAMATADDVKSLLELKQQQAGVVQAWQAVRQSEESIRQGRSIMMFTLVTIVFLPLSFLSSVFGMNNMEFTGNGWEISAQFRLMFSISAGVIVASLLFAFSTWIRAAIYYVYLFLTTNFVVKTRLYDVYLDINRPSKKVHNNIAEWADRMKMNRRKKRFEARRAKREKKEKKDEERDKREKEASRDSDHIGESKSTGNMYQEDTVAMGYETSASGNLKYARATEYNQGDRDAAREPGAMV
ncbi:hypothetical protein F4780DRAFT_769011 [Xylariomycetidae sp. FL0641]|nr:hypothetical protein F4780DRAFT_769011 [Xylariomycetidae sp. FL0641]